MSLLSFTEDHDDGAEEDNGDDNEKEEKEHPKPKNKMLSSHDVLEDRYLKKETAVSKEELEK